VDGDGVYVFFPDLGLVGVSLTGHELWRVPLGPFVNNYGMASSPMVDGEDVLLQCDQARDSFLLAVDKRSGAIRWRTRRPTTIEGWSTPIVVRERGEVVTLSSSGLEAFDRATGASRWMLPSPNSVMIPLPLLDGPRLIATFRGSDQPEFPTWSATLADLDRNQDGRLSPDEIEKTYARENFGIADPDRDGYITRSEWDAFRNRGVGEFGITCLRLADRKVIWRHKRGLPYVPSPTVFEGVLYSVRSGGIVTALDAETGEVKKEARLPLAGGEYFASPVAADGKIFLASHEGKVSVLKASLEGSDLIKTTGGRMEQLFESTDTLSRSVEEATSSVSQIYGALSSVQQGVSMLSEASDHTTQFVSQVGGAMGSIRENADQSLAVAQKVEGHARRGRKLPQRGDGGSCEGWMQFRALPWQPKWQGRFQTFF
jgi:outer membrane protein assembly factor BamB